MVRIAVCRVPGAPAPSAGETRSRRRRRPSCSRGMTTRRKRKRMRGPSCSKGKRRKFGRVNIILTDWRMRRR